MKNAVRSANLAKPGCCPARRLRCSHIRRSTFRMRWLLCLAAACHAALGGLASASQFRGLWVDAFGPGFFNAAQVKKLAADCRQYNFNAVLVEMRRRGDALYNSNCDPRTTIINTNFDALAEIIKQCHTGTPRIQVHCWVVSHFIWAWEKPPSQPHHVFNRHPEYLTKDSIGQTLIDKGYFLDPGNPDANLTIYNMARDIVTALQIGRPGTEKASLICACQWTSRQTIPVFSIPAWIRR